MNYRKGGLRHGQRHYWLPALTAGKSRLPVPSLTVKKRIFHFLLLFITFALRKKEILINNQIEYVKS